MFKSFAVVGNEAIAGCLEAQRIPFGIVQCRSSGKRIYVVESYPFLETELLGLLKTNELHLNALRKLRRQIEAKELRDVEVVHEGLVKEIVHVHSRKTEAIAGGERPISGRP